MNESLNSQKEKHLENLTLSGSTSNKISNNANSKYLYTFAESMNMSNSLRDRNDFKVKL